MAIARSSSFLVSHFFHISSLPRLCLRIPTYAPTVRVRIGLGRVRCAASESGGGQNKVSARLLKMQQILQDAEERAQSAGSEPVPKITLDHVTVSYARSGGPGGQNVNKVNTKVDMRFNVKQAHWLSERIRERILQMEKNRINKDGEIVISSTKNLHPLQISHVTFQLSKHIFIFCSSSSGVTLKMHCRNFRQLLMLHHMSRHRLLKNKRKGLQNWLPLENRRGFRIKKALSQKRRLGGPEIAGIEWAMIIDDATNKANTYKGANASG